MKTLRNILLLAFLLLSAMSVSAFQSENGEGPMLINPNTDPVLTINPLTGTPVSNPDLLLMTPVFVPLNRYPSTFRPSSGHTQAQWVFEMYVSNEESRPILMFYGVDPVGTIGRISSANYGLEELRKQYGGIIIAGGTSQAVLNSGILSIEMWYGTNYGQLYPELPAEDFIRIRDKWQKKSTPADPNNLTYTFDETPPEGGISAESLFFRYATNNQILWRYDADTGKYYRMQNSVEDPFSLTADVDKNDGVQVGVENLIILMADHGYASDPDLLGFSHVYLNYVDSRPAIIFRDGQLYHVTWTTLSDTFERESSRMRPIRFLDSEGNNFRLKPGQTWVHIVMPNNPIYEVEAELSTKTQVGSGHWFMPYISFKPGIDQNSEIPFEVGEDGLPLNDAYLR